MGLVGGAISKRRISRLALAILSLGLVFSVACGEAAPPDSPTPGPLEGEYIELPEPSHEGYMSLERALVQRRSVREYTGEPLTLEEVSQLLWAAQGITAEWGGRTAPSAGALYPLEVYLVAGDVDGLSPGVYRYRPQEHDLAKVVNRDVRAELADAALAQTCVEEGAIDIVISAVYQRTTQKYGERGIRYVHMEAGHAAQNLYLQAAALGLGMVTVGAFYDDEVKDIVGLAEDEAPLYIVPVGRKATP